MEALNPDTLSDLFDAAPTPPPLARAWGNQYLFKSWWTEERIAELERLIRLRQSGGQIAKALGTTRNAIIGKVHRLGLSLKGIQYRLTDEELQARKLAREQRARERMERKRARDAGPKLPFDPANLRMADIEPLNIPLVDLEPHHCRYPYGDDTYLFCGHQKLQDSPYCIHHFAICYYRPVNINDRYLRAMNEIAR